MQEHKNQVPLLKCGVILVSELPIKLFENILETIQLSLTSPGPLLYFPFPTQDVDPESFP